MHEYFSFALAFVVDVSIVMHARNTIVHQNEYFTVHRVILIDLIRIFFIQEIANAGIQFPAISDLNVGTMTKVLDFAESTSAFIALCHLAHILLPTNIFVLSLTDVKMRELAREYESGNMTLDDLTINFIEHVEKSIETPPLSRELIKSLLHEFFTNTPLNRKGSAIGAMWLSNCKENNRKCLNCQKRGRNLFIDDFMRTNYGSSVTNLYLAERLNAEIVENSY